MIKKLFFLMLGCFLTASVCQAQQIRTATLAVRATATVYDNLQMLTIRHLDLINPTVIDEKIKVPPITSSYAGIFKIIGNPNARVRITFLQNEIIKEQNDGLGEVSATYSLSAATRDVQAQSMLLDVGEAILPMGENGELYLWLGADLDLSNASRGLYLSEFIIEMEYI